MDDVRKAVAALLPPIIETRVTGEATVLQLFDIQGKAKQIKKVAGCRVTNGAIEKSKKVRVVRDGQTIYEGMLYRSVAMDHSLTALNWYRHDRNA